MLIQLKKKMLENQAYVPNQILLPLIAICESIGFTDVADLDVQTYKQGSTVTFWNENDESIQFENNIDNPSIYFDTGLDAQAFVKGKMTNTMSKFNGTAYGCDINFNLNQKDI